MQTLSLDRCWPFSFKKSFSESIKGQTAMKTPQADFQIKTWEMSPNSIGILNSLTKAIQFQIRRYGNSNSTTISYFSRPHKDAKFNPINIENYIENLILKNCMQYMCMCNNNKRIDKFKIMLTNSLSRFCQICLSETNPIFKIWIFVQVVSEPVQSVIVILYVILVTIAGGINSHS